MPHRHLESEEQRHGWFSTSTSGHKGGTAILLSNKFRAQCIVSDIQYDSSFDGAWTSILVAAEGRTIRVESTYFPQDGTTRRACIDDYFPELETRSDTHHVITAGD